MLFYSSLPTGFGNILHAPNGHSCQIHLNQSVLNAALFRLITLNDLRFKWQRSKTGNAKFHFARFRQKFTFVASGPRVQPIRGLR